MKFIELYSLLNEGLKDLPYSVPKNKKQLLADFYLATYPYESIKGDKTFLYTDTGEAVLRALDEAKIKIVDHLYDEMLDVTFWAIGCEIRYAGVQIEEKDIKHKMSPAFVDYYNTIDGETTREESNDNLLKIYGKTLADKKRAVEDCKKIFLARGWSDKYGGRAWANICDAWLDLYNAKSLDNKIIAIDHIIDIQHNTNTIFDKVEEYYSGGYVWIKSFLDLKSRIKSPWELFNKASYDMKQIVRPLTKLSGGGAEEDASKKHEKSAQLADIKQDWSAIQHIKNPDKDIQLAAVEKKGNAIQFIRNPDKDVQLAAVKRNGLAIQHINNPDKDVELTAVKENGFAIQFIKNPDKDVQLAAVKQDGWAIQYIKNPDKDVQLAAVDQNGYAIQYIKNPDKDVQLAAVKKNGYAIQYIENPDPEVIKASKQ